MSVYLDHAATTPVLPEAVEAFAAEAARIGNPSSLHTLGRQARAGLETSRERIAAALGAEPAEVVLTSGGCEGDSLAVVGGWEAARAAEPERTTVLLSAVEHAAVREAAAALSTRHGAQVRHIAVDPVGVVDLDHLAMLLAEHAPTTAVVSVMAANNETGAVQPLAAVVEEVRRRAGRRVLVHSDAVAGLAYLPLRFDSGDLDALTLSGHKIGAPAGIGALLVRRTAALAPLVHGGGQERGVRSGTVPVALAAALAVAVEHAVVRREAEVARLRALRDALEAGVRATVPGVRVNGGPGRLPGLLHLTLPGIDVDALLLALDAAGVQASAGAACHAGVTQPSDVLLAMGDDERTARSTLRLSLGRTSTGGDVERVLAVLPGAVATAREVGDAAARFRDRRR